MGMGKVLRSVFGISQTYGMIIGFLIVVLYTSAGGFIAVSWTDFFQALFMIFALFFLFTGAAKEVMSASMSLEGTTATLMIANLSIALGYPGQPHILVRYMALRSREDLKKSAFISII